MLPASAPLSLHKVSSSPALHDCTTNSAPRWRTTIASRELRLAGATLLHTRVFKDVKWSYHWYSIGGSALELITKDLFERSGQTAPLGAELPTAAKSVEQLSAD